MPRSPGPKSAAPAPAGDPAGAPNRSSAQPGSPGLAAFEALGRTSSYLYQGPDTSVLEAFANPSPGSPWAVSLLCQEFTALCPVTGQPDYGRLRIDYVPGDLCVESKSLKLYLVRYRNQGTFHEACVNRVADDLCSVLHPVYLRVYGDFAPRGGIAIKPLAVREAPDLDDGGRRRCLLLLDQMIALAGAAHSI